MKWIFTLLTILTIVSGSTHAQTESKTKRAVAIQAVPDGSYLGRFRGSRKGPINLIVKSYPGCQGCFVAIFIVDPDQTLFGNKPPQLAAFSAIPAEQPTVNAKGQYSALYGLTHFNVAAHPAWTRWAEAIKVAKNENGNFSPALHELQRANVDVLTALENDNDSEEFRRFKRAIHTIQKLVENPSYSKADFKGAVEELEAAGSYDKGIDLKSVLGGKVTVAQADPDLSLTITRDPGKDSVHFAVTHVNPKPKMNLSMTLTAGMEFIKEKTSPFEFSKAFSGHNRMSNKRESKFNVGMIKTNPSDGAHSAVTFLSELRFVNAGTYALKEQVPYVYSLSRIQLLETGQKEAKNPDYLVMFVEKRGRKLVLFVNPAQDTNALKYVNVDGDADQMTIASQESIEQQRDQVASLNQAMFSPENTSIHYPTRDSLTKLAEIEGGPTAVVTDAQVRKALAGWVQKIGNALSRVRNEVAYILPDEDRKKFLVERLSKIAQDSEMSPKDLLSRQALYGALTLVRIMDLAQKHRGPTPGEVSAQVDLLMKSMKLASDYIESDQQYLETVEQNNDHREFNDMLIDFGVNISQYIAYQAVRMRPLNLLASYGALRWSLGVLRKDIIDDVASESVRDTLAYLHQGLEQFPTMEQAAVELNDLQIAVKIQELKRLFNQVQLEIENNKGKLKR